MSKRKTVTINVTREDIDTGRCTDQARCAVAQAIRRVLKPGTRLQVDGSGAYLLPRWSKRVLEDVSDFDDGSVSLPFRATSFIRDFDRCASSPWDPATKQKSDLKPFSFKTSIDRRFLP